MKSDSLDRVKALRRFVDKAKLDKSLLFELRFSKRRSGRIWLSRTSIAAVAGYKEFSPHFYEQYTEESVLELLSILRKEGLFIEGHTAAALNAKMEIKNWKANLDDKSKRDLAWRGLRFKFPKDVLKLFKAAKDPAFVKNIKKELLEEAIKLGGAPTRITPELIANFLMKIEKDKSLLWGLELTQNALNISVKYLVNTLSGRSDEWDKFPTHWIKNASKLNDLQETLFSMMIAEGVIDESLTRADNQFRMNVRNWWESIENKEDVPLHGNCIRLPHYLFHSSKISQLVKKEVRSDLNKQLVELSLLVSAEDYIPQKDRRRDHNHMRSRIDKKEFFDRLREQDPMENLTSPLAIYDVKYPQLYHIFANASLSCSSGTGIGNYKTAYTHFSQYIEDLGIKESSTLYEILDSVGGDCLTAFKLQYCYPKLDIKELSPKSVISLLSALRSTLFGVKKSSGLDFTFYDTLNVDDATTTNTHKPYDSVEIASLRTAIEQEYEDLKSRIDHGYMPIDRQSAYFKEHQYEPEIKARVYFEDKLNAKLVFHADADNGDRKAYTFLLFLSDKQLKLHDLYESWGLIPMVSPAVINIFLMRLCESTGINVDSLVDLELGSFRNRHPVTGKPSITFWKRRSTGEREYHLDIFDGQLQWLSKAQSHIVAEVFEYVEKLTKPLRNLLPNKDANKLFVVMQRGQKKAIHLKKSTLRGSQIKKFAEKHKIEDKNGNPTEAALTRFRPTFASQLIEMGVSLREIQFSLGHASMRTTANYLDQLDLNEKLRKKTYEAIRKVSDSAIASSGDKIKSSYYKANKEQAIMQTPLGGCRNIFNPPSFIKNSSIYVEGQPCAQYNKCLVCENILLTSLHLPALFALRRDYLALASRNAIANTPYGVVITENLSVLEDILNPSISEFSEEELTQAEKDSMFVETGAIDNFGG